MLKDCTFKPKITARSAKLDPHSPKTLMEGGRRAREAWRVKELQRKAQKELEGVTFRPHIATAKGFEHVRARVDVNDPSNCVKDFFSKRKAREAQREREQREREEQELRECTFKPRTTPLPPYLLKRYEPWLSALRFLIDQVAEEGEEGEEEEEEREEEVEREEGAKREEKKADEEKKEGEKESEDTGRKKGVRLNAGVDYVVEERDEALGIREGTGRSDGVVLLKATEAIKDAGEEEGNAGGQSEEGEDGEDGEFEETLLEDGKEKEEKEKEVQKEGGPVKDTEEEEKEEQEQEQERGLQTVLSQFLTHVSRKNNRLFSEDGL